MPQWDGTTERRADDISTRVVLLEHCHTENKESLAADQNTVRNYINQKWAIY